MLENRQHVVGLVGKGHILGIEEAVLGQLDKYTTTAVCHSIDGAELYRLEKELFTSRLMPQSSTWGSLINKSNHQVQIVATSIENMQLSNLSIMDAMKRGGDSTLKQKISK